MRFSSPTALEERFGREQLDVESSICLYSLSLPSRNAILCSCSRYIWCSFFSSSRFLFRHLRPLVDCWRRLRRVLSSPDKEASELSWGSEVARNLSCCDSIHLVRSLSDGELFRCSKFLDTIFECFMVLCWTKQEDRFTVVFEQVELLWFQKNLKCSQPSSRQEREELCSKVARLYARVRALKTQVWRPKMLGTISSTVTHWCSHRKSIIKWFERCRYGDHEMAIPSIYFKRTTIGVRSSSNMQNVRNTLGREFWLSNASNLWHWLILVRERGKENARGITSMYSK